MASYSPWEKATEKVANAIIIKGGKNELLKHIALIVIVSVIVYANTFGNEFVWDDRFQIVESVLVKDLRNIPSAFTMGVWDFNPQGDMGDILPYYRPIFLLSLMFDYQIWGLNPSGYHLTNLLLHVLNSVLLYVILNAILDKRAVSLMAALLFAVHPIHIESVTFISGRTDVLFVFFFLLSFYLYMKSESNRKYFAASMVAFFFAMLSKEMAIMLPIIIILYDICFVVKKIDWRIVERLKHYLPFFAVALLYFFVRFFVVKMGTGATGYLGGSIGTTIFTMSIVFVEYIWLLFVPVNLSMVHSNPIETSILEPTVLVSIALLLAILAFALKMYRRSKVVFFSIVWFFVTLLPVSQIIPTMTFALIAERYLYLPSIGFCILIAVIIQKALDHFPQRRIRTVVIFCLILILAFYSVRTIVRNNDWKDELTLWSETVKSSPYSAGARYKLGNAYSEKGLHDEAIAEYKEALRINSDHISSHNNLGNAYFRKGMYDEAIAEYNEVLRIDSNYFKAHYNLGSVYLHTEQYDLARQEWQKALEIDPNLEAAKVKLRELEEMGY